MDENKLHTVAIALQWEARYRKGEHLVGKGAFLPELDSLDKDFAKALDLFGVKSGRLLDIGTGLGVQARHFSRLGFTVTATDVSSTAVEYARKAAVAAGDQIEFLADDILRTALRGPYDLIVDRGCYTLLHDWMREDYCCNVYNLLAPEGLLFLKIDAQKKAVTEQLADRFRVIHTYETSYHLEIGPKAVFNVLESL